MCLITITAFVLQTRILRKNISERCGRLLRTIREGKSLLKKNRKSQRKLSLRKDVQEDSSSLRENITKKVLLGNTNDQQNLILDKEEDIRSNLKEDIKEIPLSLQKNIQRKAKSQSPVLVKNIQESSRLLKKSIEDSSLLVKKDIQKGIQKEELVKEEDLLVTHDQRNITLVKRNNHNNSLLKEEGTNKNVKSFLLPKKNAEEYSLTKTKFEKQLTLKGVGKDLSSKNILKNIVNENSQLKTKSVRDINLFLKKYVEENPSLTRSSTENSSHLINKNVDDNLLLIQKNISTINSLMQLTKKDIQENVLKLSKSIFEENVFLVENKDSKIISQLIVKSSLLSQKKDIPNSQLQLIEKIIQDDSLLTKNLISLVEKEKDISVISQSQLIERDIPENFSLVKDLYSSSRKIIFSTKQDIYLFEEEKDISEENVLSQLTKNLVQSNFFLSKKSYFPSEKDISPTEKKEELLQLTRKTIQNNLLLKKNLYFTVENQVAFISSLRLKQVRSDSNLFYRSIVHRCCLLKNIQQVFQGSKKKVRKGSNSVCKVNQSPSPEENWSGQESTGSDIIGSADKYDSVAKCKFMVSNRYAKHQSIAKPLEEHIQIFKISSCPEQLINISEEVLLTDSIAGSIESVSVHLKFEKNFKKNPKNLVTKEKNFDENLKYRIINVQESEKTLKEPINKIKDSEKILTNQVTKGNINNLFTVKIIDKLEAPYHQRLIQRNSQNSFDLTNHQFSNPINPHLSLIIYSKEDSEKKNPFNKIEDSITKIKDPKNILRNSFVKIHTNNSYTSKIVDNLEVLNNQRLIQKSLVLIDYQSGNSQLSLIERKLLESEKRHKIISKRHYKNLKMRLNVRLIRIRDKLVLCLSALAILFTLLLVMDLQMDLGYSGHHLNPNHARIRIGDPPDIDTVYNNFRRKFLQRGNSSREQANSDVTPTIEKSRKSSKVTPLSSTMRKHDDYTDLVNLVVNGHAVNVDEEVVRISGEDQEYNPTIGELRKMTLK